MGTYSSGGLFRTKFFLGGSSSEGDFFEGGGLFEDLQYTLDLEESQRKDIRYIF